MVRTIPIKKREIGQDKFPREIGQENSIKKRYCKLVRIFPIKKREIGQENSHKEEGNWSG